MIVLSGVFYISCVGVSKASTNEFSTNEKIKDHCQIYADYKTCLAKNKPLNYGSCSDFFVTSLLSKIKKLQYHDIVPVLYESTKPYNQKLNGIHTAFKACIDHQEQNHYECHYARAEAGLRVYKCERLFNTK